jgi:hypothetical protein
VTVTDATMSDEPRERMTRMCDAMTKTMVAHPEYRESDRCQIFIEDDTTAGIVLHGYDDQFDAVIALLIHLRGIFRANGQDLQLMALGDDGVDIA